VLVKALPGSILLNHGDVRREREFNAPKGGLNAAAKLQCHYDLSAASVTTGCEVVKLTQLAATLNVDGWLREQGLERLPKCRQLRSYGA